MRSLLLWSFVTWGALIANRCAVGEMSQDARAHYDAGLAAKHAKQYEKAVAELKGAIEREKDYLDAHWALAWVYVAKEQKDLAGEHFRQVIRIAPDSEKGRQAKTALARMALGVTPEGSLSAQGTSVAPPVAGQTSKQQGTPCDRHAESPTLMSNGTALLDAATVAKLANGSWEHTDSEIIIKGAPDVHCPFQRKQFHTGDEVYAVSGPALYFSWLDVGLVPVRVLTLYGWKISWDGAANIVRVRSDGEQHAFRILSSTEFFAKYGAAPLPAWPSGERSGAGPSANTPDRSPSSSKDYWNRLGAQLGVQHMPGESPAEYEQRVRDVHSLRTLASLLEGRHTRNWVGGLLSGTDRQSGTPPGVPINNDDVVSAKIAARYFVKGKLLSPGSARFSGIFNDIPDETVTRLSTTTCRVSGWVQAKNAFGVAVRNRYTCTLRKIKEHSPPLGKWACGDVSIW